MTMMRDSIVVLAILGLVYYMATLNQESQSHITANPYKEFNQWLNSLLIPNSVEVYFVEKLGEESGYYMLCYLRDLVGGTVVYWLTAGLWHIAIYDILGNKLFTSRGRPFPERSVIIEQIQLAQSSIFLYAGLPILSEYLIENKLTKTYYNFSDVGGIANYFMYMVIYLGCVEFGIYWVHRTLHTNKVLYKYIHGLHHKYNKPTTLTPWTSIAFNPIDGILQASPYVIFLFFVPVHYFTHVFLLFFSGVWATNIHDAVTGNTEPVMGAGYHTIHHTHYHYNFGQFFIFMDYLFGTLRSPAFIEEMEKQKRSSENLEKKVTTTTSSPTKKSVTLKKTD